MTITIFGYPFKKCDVTNFSDEKKSKLVYLTEKYVMQNPALGIFNISSSCLILSLRV